MQWEGMWAWGGGEEAVVDVHYLYIHTRFNSTRVQQGLVVAAVCCPVVQKEEDGRA